MTEVAEQPPPPLSPLQVVRGRGPVRGRLALLGPAFVAAVAYIDPGNFATNIAGGAKYGFLLVWVIVAANLMATHELQRRQRRRGLLGELGHAAVHDKRGLGQPKLVLGLT
jgi:hypothetical protein